MTGASTTREDVERDAACLETLGFYTEAETLRALRDERDEAIKQRDFAGAALRLGSDAIQRVWDERDAARARIEELSAEVERMRDALQWMVDNDETNEGDTPLDELSGKTWNEVNAYWIEGLNRARAALAGAPRHE